MYIHSRIFFQKKYIITGTKNILAALKFAKVLEAGHGTGKNTIQLHDQRLKFIP